MLPIALAGAEVRQRGVVASFIYLSVPPDSFPNHLNHERGQRKLYLRDASLVARKRSRAFTYNTTPKCLLLADSGQIVLQTGRKSASTAPGLTAQRGLYEGRIEVIRAHSSVNDDPLGIQAA